jgi:hypothetical protein
VRWTVRRRWRHAKDGEEEETRERETKVRRSKQKKSGVDLRDRAMRPNLNPTMERCVMD